MKITSTNISEFKEIIAVILEDTDILSTIDKIIETITSAYKFGKKTLFCGNGGSATQAQHLAAELSGKFKIDRKPLPAEACHNNTAFLTAVSNDYNFEKGYERYIEAFGEEGDILFGLSTSGNSTNIIKAFSKAKDLGLTTIALTGKTGGKLKNLSDLIIYVPSENVPRIQEAHLLIGHIICETVEKELFGK